MASALQGVADHLAQIIQAEGLGYVIESADLDGLHCLIDGGIAGHENDHGLRGHALNLLQYLHAIGIPQADVSDQQIRRGLADAGNGLGGGNESFHLVAILGQGMNQTANRDDFIIKDVDTFFLCDRIRHSEKTPMVLYG